ncbi:MAG: molybdenum ABC transporter ATP-binding protein [Rhizobacter sp.]|nr:molybdenum ABC transporter ATP-binding protein [Rhizobacter sp.]
MNTLATESPADAIESALTVDHPGFSLGLHVRLPSRGFTALFGPSGSGKTSALRAVAGLQRARGRLVVQGEVWQDDARRICLPTHRRALGYVFQDAALFAHLTVRANLEFGRRRVPASERRVDFDAVVALLGLEPLLARSTAALSGGERQRVAIGRALAASPRLLLLDEPMAALDLKRRAELLPYLMRLQSELDVPALYVSHAPEEVAQLAGYLVLLDSGTVLASGHTAQLMTRLDLPLAHGDTAQAVLSATVLSHDADSLLMRVAFSGGQLLLPAQHAVVGSTRLVRVSARDVSLTLSRHADSSILNILDTQVLAVVDDTPGHAMVRLQAGREVLLARVTRQSVKALALHVGQPVFAQIKAAAIGQ